MTVEITSSGTANTSSTQKSKKSLREDKQESHKTEGAGAHNDKSDKKKRKKDKKLKVSQSAGEEDRSMAVDSPDDSGSVQPEKKKKKRKRDEEEAPTEAGPSKKDKKKRRKNGDLAEHMQSPESADGPQVDSSPSKKDKKKRKHDAETTEAAEQPTVDPGVGGSKKDKKKRKRDSGQDSSESKPKIAGAPSSADTDAFLSKHSVTIHVPSSSEPVIPVLSFDQLDIPSDLQSAFKGFKEPTPIQACSWPPALQGKDVVGIAETGSGKTLAFGLPALARLISSPVSSPKESKSTTVSVLVVAPTRELAIQTHDTLTALGEPFGIASVAVFGGVDKGPQVKALKNANKDGKTTRIVVGTPGRILDLVNDGICDLSRVTYLVLDEADRMLDKGFENDIRAIIGHAKQGAERQTLMFSATWPEAVRRLASSFQRDPVRVTVGSDDLTANSRVEQFVEVFDDSRSKDQRLLNHLRSLSHKKSGSPEDARILVFALYKKEATRVEGMLRSKGYTVAGLHGDMSQVARMDALQSFKTGKTGLLVATDVAARGLDIPNVAAVINYTFPLTIEDYIHRIGRTGRGGRTGKSITFFTGDNHERALAGELAKVLRESGFECEDLKKFPMTIKKKTHSLYGAFFRDDIPAPKGPTKITFD
ncbi:DEAD-domain-containing protein [Daedalea quercina L-15889]|uniref:RNA helicase n=1 Tax=Daedalea quercina L-15889 TaxID=1314783 RepID=A0A165PP69_9APHY|nr:DEAD-domain-containing protein [Daedalea quercina L-15889]